MLSQMTEVLSFYAWIALHCAYISGLFSQPEPLDLLWHQWDHTAPSFRLVWQTGSQAQATMGPISVALDYVNNLFLKFIFNQCFYWQVKLYVFTVYIVMLWSAYRCQFLSPSISIDGLWGCFRIFAIVNGTAINTGVQTSLSYTHFIFFGYVLSSGGIGCCPGAGFDCGGPSVGVHTGPVLGFTTKYCAHFPLLPANR